MLPCFVAILFGICQSASVKEYADVWPADITNVGRLFQTMADHSEQVALPVFGRIPSWIRGNFYRNGPG